MTTEPAWMDEARRLYVEGFGTYEVIGQKLGKSKPSISRACRGLKPPVSNQKLHWDRFRADGRETKRKGVRAIDRDPGTMPQPCMKAENKPRPAAKPMTIEEKVERARQRQLREQQRKSVERRARLMAMMPRPDNDNVVVNSRGISLPRVSILN